jgi:hypothetical protein
MPIWPEKKSVFLERRFDAHPSSQNDSWNAMMTVAKLIPHLCVASRASRHVHSVASRGSRHVYRVTCIASRASRHGRKIVLKKLKKSLIQLALITGDVSLPTDRTICLDRPSCENSIIVKHFKTLRTSFVHLLMDADSVSFVLADFETSWTD